ncbi:MAG: ATP-binding cassette domain-containing protein, partial [Clostridia bacterium]|nr:ATP-binding cassette domain-containing protein [Clostridia bacterium]
MGFIQADKLTYTYEGNLVPAVKEVSLSFEKGSYTAIIGHNGSGKSTLAKLLCGIFTPTGGKVLIDGMDTADEDNMASIREKCGMVFQNPDNQIVSSVVEEDVA